MSHRGRRRAKRRGTPRRVEPVVQGLVLECNLHGLLAEKATVEFDNAIVKAFHMQPRRVWVMFIHGFHHGRTLLDLVRRRARDQRRRTVEDPYNFGITYVEV